MAITKEEILMGRAAEEELTPEQQENLQNLWEKISKVREEYGQPMKVASGYRTPAINEATKNSGKNSWHMQCAAIDIRDTTGELWSWVMENLQLMKDLGLYLEDRRHCPTWVHFQIYPPKSGHRIFLPSSKPAPAPDIWDGKYDKSFD